MPKSSLWRSHGEIINQRRPIAFKNTRTAPRSAPIARERKITPRARRARRRRDRRCRQQHPTLIDSPASSAARARSARQPAALRACIHPVVNAPIRAIAACEVSSATTGSARKSARARVGAERDRRRHPTTKRERLGSAICREPPASLARRSAPLGRARGTGAR